MNVAVMPALLAVLVLVWWPWRQEAIIGRP